MNINKSGGYTCTDLVLRLCYVQCMYMYLNVQLYIVSRHASLPGSDL